MKVKEINVKITAVLRLIPVAGKDVLNVKRNKILCTQVGVRTNLISIMNMEMLISHQHQREEAEFSHLRKLKIYTCAHL